MVTSRSVPQQTAQIFATLAGQKRTALRFSQIGQNTEFPHSSRTIEQDTLRRSKRQKTRSDGSRYDEIDPEVSFHGGNARGSPKPCEQVQETHASAKRNCDLGFESCLVIGHKCQ